MSNSIEYHNRDILLHLGFDLENDPNLQGTPERWALMIKELTTPEDFKFTTFPNEPRVDQMIVVSGIRVYSLCAHHLLPFFGTAAVGYIPKAKRAGLSKLPRVVEWLSRDLTDQETLTQRSLDWIVSELDPIGAAVTLSCRHLCMEHRGVEKSAVTTTSSLSGVIKMSADARAEFYDRVREESK